MPSAPGHTGMPRVTAGKLIGHIITVPTHTLMETEPKHEKKHRFSSPSAIQMTPLLPGLWAHRVCVHAVMSVSLARVPQRWVTAGGDVDQLNAGCLVWWMSQSGGLGEKHRWAEAMCCPQLSQWIRANILRRDQPCRSTLERRSASVPSLKLSSSLTCLSLSPFLQQPYKHWQLCSSVNEYGVTDWLGAPNSFPWLRNWGKWNRCQV